MKWSWNPLRLLTGPVLAPVRSWLGRHPWVRWLLYAAPFLVLLALLNPVVTLLTTLLGFVVRVFEPLLQTPSGRLLLLNLVLVAVAAVGFVLVRSRLRQLLGDVVLRWHLLGLAALVRGDRATAERRFRAVLRLAAWLDLRRAAATYPAVAQDARLKLARSSLERQRPKDTLRHLSYVRETHLPRELRASLLELRARALLQLPDALPENVDAALRQALDLRPRHVELLVLLREHCVRTGALAAAIDTQERLLPCLPAAQRDEERARLARLWVARAEQERAQGHPDRARDHARRALKVEAGLEPALLLLGDLALAARDPDAALRAWGQAATPAALGRAEALLRSQPDLLPAREVLARFPTRGMLAVLARLYAAHGDQRKAANALRIAAEQGTPSPLFTALRAGHAEATGDAASAADGYRQAILGLLGDREHGSMEPQGPG